MFDYIFTFRSLTGAQKARELLSAGNVFSSVMRAPKRLSAQGCGYALRVSAANGRRALAVLRGGGASFGHLYRLFHDGRIEEVRG